MSEPGQTPAIEKSPFRFSRVRLGLLIGGLVIGMTMLGGWFWSVFVLLFMLAGYRELSRIMEASGLHPSRTIVLVSGAVMVAMATLGRPDLIPPVLTAAIIASFLRLLLLHPRASIGDIGATLVAIFYIVYLPLHYILLRQIAVEGVTNPLVQPGLYYVMMVIFVISFSDIGAYYVGKKLGRHPLYPAVSPKKTREGAVGGLFFGVLGGMGFAWVIQFPLLHAALLGILLVIVGQLGDLTESMLKRDAGLKDSGGILKGHGGILDRTDSYIFSGAVCYYYIYWIILQQGLAADFLRWLSRIG